MEKFKNYNDKFAALREQHKQQTDKIHKQMEDVAAEFAGVVQAEFESMYGIKPNDQLTYNGTLYYYKRLAFRRNGDWVELYLVLGRVKKDGTESKAAPFMAYFNENNMGKYNIKTVCGQQ